MSLKILLLLSVFSCAMGELPRKTGRKYGCGGGITPGQVKIEKFYWYACGLDGRLQSKGCVTQTGRIVNIGERFNLGSHIIVDCVWNKTSQSIQVEHTACISHDGHEVAPLTTWKNDQSIHACHKFSSGVLQEKLIGCVHKGMELGLGQRRVSDGIWSECRVQRDGRSAAMEPVGCIDSAGRAHEWGRSFRDGDTKYYCKCSTETMRCDTRPVGCVFKGKEYTAYQLIEDPKDNSLWRCMVPNGRGAKSELTLVGCMSSTNGRKETKRLNCVWDDGYPPFQYVRRCVANGRSTKIETLACLYDRIAEVKEGCINMVGIGNQAVGCVRKGEDLEIVQLGTGPQTDIVHRGRRRGLKPACWMLENGTTAGACC